ncbi:MAG: PAS domain S-box protein, partial [FCB group bacterium]|nr:PAS domain S-box protein [FCB group bacterium]
MFESGLIIFDNNLRIVSLNNAVKRLIGESSLENAGLKFLETGVRSLNGERKKAPLKDFVISVLKEGTILNLRMKTGLNIVLESLRDENGAIKGASLILKNAESRYNKQRKCVHRSDNFAGDYLQKLLQSSNAAIVVFDNKGKFITFNPAAERLTGYTAAEMVGKQNICLIFPDREKIEQYKSSLFRNEKIEDAELPVKCKDGRFIHTLTSITMLRNDDSTPMGFMAGAGDISPPKKLENELGSHFQKLEKAGAERTPEIKKNPHFLNQGLNRSHSYFIITTDSFMKINM